MNGAPDIARVLENLENKILPRSLTHNGRDWAVLVQVDSKKRDGLANVTNHTLMVEGRDLLEATTIFLHELGHIARGHGEEKVELAGKYHLKMPGVRVVRMEIEATEWALAHVPSWLDRGYVMADLTEALDSYRMYYRLHTKGSWEVAR